MRQQARITHLRQSKIIEQRNGGIQIQKNRKIKNLAVLWTHFHEWIVAERTGLEPATPCVTGRYSNRLNYRSALCSVGNEANITDCLDLRQRFFSSFESFAAKIAQVAIFSAFHRYLCSPEATSAFLLHQIETGFMSCNLFICRKNNA